MLGSLKLWLLYNSIERDTLTRIDLPGSGLVNKAWLGHSTENLLKNKEIILEFFRAFKVILNLLCILAATDSHLLLDSG
jgi:hypothetical protein